MSSCENINDLISGYLDDELTQGSYQLVDVHLRSCTHCRKTLDDLTKLRGAVANSQPDSEMEHEQWEKMMNDIPARFSRGIGWLLLITGAVTLIGLVIWEFAIDSEITIWAKLGTGAVWFGLLFLFLSVLRQRWMSYKSDKYKDVPY